MNTTRRTVGEPTACLQTARPTTEIHTRRRIMAQAAQQRRRSTSGAGAAAKHPVADGFEFSGHGGTQWVVGRQIGEGTYSLVFEVTRKDKASKRVTQTIAQAVKRMWQKG